MRRDDYHAGMLIALLLLSQIQLLLVAEEQHDRLLDRQSTLAQERSSNRWQHETEERDVMGWR
jgi:hypothetical protein